MQLAFGDSHLGDRTENLDRYGHFSGPDWFVSFVIDGFKPSSPHYVDSLYCNLQENLSNLTEDLKVTRDILEASVNKSFCDASGQGKASLVFIIGVSGAANVYTAGDSRAYFFADNIRTTDHSIAQKMVSDGRSPEGSLRKHPYRRYLTKRVDENSDLSSLDCEGINGDKGFLLCSDGFWCSALSDDEIYAAKSYTQAEDLFHTIKERKVGLRDNITMMLVLP